MKHLGSLIGVNIPFNKTDKSVFHYCQKVILTYTKKYINLRPKALNKIVFCELNLWRCQIGNHLVETPQDKR